MSVMMMLAASGKLESFTETFTGNTTWVAPEGVTTVNLVGNGQSGQPAGTETRTAALVSVIYSTSGSGAGPAVNDWSNMHGAATGRVATIDGGGTVTYTQVGLVTYANGTETLDGSNVTLNGVVPGSASLITTGGWQTSGAIGASGNAIVQYLESAAATTGASATGFGETFPGGVGGPATPVTHDNVAVTPSASYPLVIPSGGSITITYQK